MGEISSGVTLKNHSAIPEGLRKLKQWCLWCLWDEKKIPCGPSGTPISTTKESDWVDFETATSAYVCDETGKFKGIGFVFKEGGGLVGIDLDDAFLYSGRIKTWALKVLARLDTGGYVEKSPSGKGLHIIVRGKKPGAKCRRTVIANGERVGELEMYDSARYFTMTGNLYDTSFASLVEAQPAIDAIYKAIEPESERIKKAPEEALGGVPSGAESNALLSDADIYTLISSSQQAAKFSRLTTGTLEEVLQAYENDHSRAVHALCAVVSFYTKSFAAMDAVFKASPLYSKHWAPSERNHGKWARLGEAEFNKLRRQYEARGDVYEAGKRTNPEHDFTEVPGDAEQKQITRQGEDEYQRHIELALEQYEEGRRDLLSGVLHLRQGGEWHPAFNRSIIGALRGDCCVRGRAYKKARLEDYLHRYERSLTPRLLIDLPRWDGRDRVAEMVSCLNFTEDFSQDLFLDCFKDWLARMWGKVENPLQVQNRCIVLSGRQGIGKDVWVKSCFFGLNKYLADLTLNGYATKEADVAVVMGSSVVMFISEFDKTNELGIETLKDLVTKDSFTAVRKYDRDATTLLNRCSIIGACNPEHVLRDVTGNRRFLVFRLEGGPGDAIRWTYPKYDRVYSLQIIAQARELCREQYQASEVTERRIREITEAYTPEDPNTDLIADFESEVVEMAKNDPMARGALFPLRQLDDVLTRLFKNYGEKRNTVLRYLRAAGCQYRDSTTRFYGTREAAKRGASLLTEEQATGWEEGFN